jgi:hypothetical protein
MIPRTRPTLPTPAPAEPKETEQVQVTDIDFTFLGNHPLPLTLKPGDSMEATDEAITVTMPKMGATVIVYKANLLYSAERTRTMSREKKQNVS